MRTIVEEGAEEALKSASTPGQLPPRALSQTSPQAALTPYHQVTTSWADPCTLFLLKAHVAIAEARSIAEKTDGVDFSSIVAWDGAGTDGGASGRAALGETEQRPGAIEGRMLKKSKSNVWQQRFFLTRGNFLLYSRVEGGNIQGGIDLGTPQSSIERFEREDGVKCIRVTGLSGTEPLVEPDLTTASAKSKEAKRKKRAKRVFEIAVDIKVRGPSTAQWVRTLKQTQTFARRKTVKEPSVKTARRGSTLMFATPSGRSASIAAMAEGSGYTAPVESDVIALYERDAKLYATATAAEVKLKPQGKLLDPRCLYRVRYREHSVDGFDRISLESVSTGKYLGVKNGIVSCSLPYTKSNGAVQQACVFTAVVVAEDDFDHDGGDAVTGRPDGVQIKLRNDVVGARGGSRWLAKTARQKKQRIVVAGTRRGASNFEMLLIRRNGEFTFPIKCDMHFLPSFSSLIFLAERMQASSTTPLRPPRWRRTRPKSQRLRELVLRQSKPQLQQGEPAHLASTTGRQS